MVLISFADLLKQKWANNDLKTVEPAKFKRHFGEKNTIFSGAQQEDAHEYILTLMNDISEEVGKKKEQNGVRRSELKTTTNQEDVLSYFQRHHLAESNSVVTELFRGVLHNTISCGVC